MNLCPSRLSLAGLCLAVGVLLTGCAGAGSFFVPVYDGPTNTATSTSTLGPTNTPTVIDAPGSAATPTATVDASLLFPNGLAVDSRAHLVYVTSKDNHRLFVVDDASLKVVDEVSVGRRPFGVALNTATNRVYVANWGTKDITVLDATTRDFLHSIYVGPSPTFVDINPQTNRIYTVKYGSNALVVINGDTDAIETSVGTGGVGAWGLAVNPNLNRVYVGNRDSGTVTTLDGNNGYEILYSQTIKPCGGTGSAPYALGFNPVNNKLYIACSPFGNVDSAAVYAASSSGLTPLAFFAIGDGSDTGGGGVAVDTATGNVFFTNSRANTVSVVSGTADQVIGTVATGKNPYPAAADPTTKRVYIGNRNSHDLTVIEDTFTRPSTSTPTNTPTATATRTRRPTSTPTATAGPTNTPTKTPTTTATRTRRPTSTPTATAGPTNTPTTTAAPTNTPTAGPTSTSTPTTTAGPTSTPTATPVLGAWRGMYFTNPWLYGPPALVRYDAAINFDWGDGSPAPQIPADNFSVRWTRTLPFDAGRYRFTTSTDDGVRLYLDGQLIVDRWCIQAVTSCSAERNLSAGQHSLRMEYFEAAGKAVARLSWKRLDTPPPPAGWRGEYFANRALSGPPAMVRDDAEINFNWGSSSPASPKIPPDDFSVRWTRTINLSGGRYRFRTTTDDGVRLYVDRRMVMQRWQDMAVTTFNVYLDLAAGNHSVRLEYYEHVGDAVAQLSIEKVAPPKPLPVGSIVTCTPPGNSWVKVYRLDGNRWTDTNPNGYRLIGGGCLSVDGLMVDVIRYGAAGHPYRVEVWTNGVRVHSVGNTAAGEAPFRVRAYANNYTPWRCW